jgi:glutamate racemase
MVIGVFDSGVGGLSVANAIKDALPEHQVILRQDEKHIPYGKKTSQQVYGYVLPILKQLVSDGCDAIVIACNTVSTNHLERLKAQIKVPLIGVEPMIQSASEITKSKVIAVCATPLTLKSDRYAWLKSEYCQDVTVIEPDCSDWALMIESNEIDHQKINDQIEAALEQTADVIVLGCTHYHWIEREINELASGKASVIQPEQAVIKHLWRELERLA